MLLTCCASPSWKSSRAWRAGVLETGSDTRFKGQADVEGGRRAAQEDNVSFPGAGPEHVWLLVFNQLGSSSPREEVGPGSDPFPCVEVTIAHGRVLLLLNGPPFFFVVL